MYTDILSPIIISFTALLMNYVKYLSILFGHLFLNVSRHEKYRLLFTTFLRTEPFVD